MLQYPIPPISYIVIILGETWAPKYAGLSKSQLIKSHHSQHWPNSEVGGGAVWAIKGNLGSLSRSTVDLAS